MSMTNYKQKYMELRQKFMSSVDAAFRAGYEQGQQDAQTQQAQDAQAQAQEMQMAGAQGQQEGSPGQAPEEMETNSANPQGSELDQHIAKLESMLGKSEELDKNELKKALDDLKFSRELQKSAKAIPAIAKSLKKPFNIGPRANHNLPESAKRGVSMQHKIVSDIMKSWSEEEKKASNDIMGTLGIEGLLKKE